MAKLIIPRIHLTRGGTGEQVAALRERISRGGTAPGDPKAGDAENPARLVERICADVRSRGLQAVLDYTLKFDKVRLTADTLRVSEGELADAYSAAEPSFLETVRHIRQNVLSLQFGLLHRDAVLTVPDSHEIRLRYTPIQRVGICVPGGMASYPSTLLMTVCPAQAAGVKEIAVVMPPTPQGAYNKDLLAGCKALGVREVYRVGGAQAVAALAYGVEAIPPVDMIVGPGNVFVTLAKRAVFGQVAIDMLAGPTEVVVLADDSASPDIVAADLIAQAEHPGIAILVTWYEPLLDQVLSALERQLAMLERGTLARESLENSGTFIVAQNPEDAITCVNLIAPEHVQIATRNPDTYAATIENAGAIFVGHETAVALGDYVAGPSHVLPTSGTARFASGLSANDFLRRSAVMTYTRKGLEQEAPHVRLMAHREGLSAHAASIDIRLGRVERPKSTRQQKTERTGVR
jgi:histidinol dehydrogenase